MTFRKTSCAVYFICSDDGNSSE